MVNCEERVLAALEFKETDRVPICDNALQIYPAVKTLIQYHLLPTFMQNWIDNLYSDLIGSVRHTLGMDKRFHPKNWLIKLLGSNIDPLIERFLASPVSEDINQKVKTLKLYYDTCVRLGVDLISIPIFPNINVRGLLNRNEKKYLVTEDFALFTVDTSGDLKGIGIVHQDDVIEQIKAYKNALKNYDIEKVALFYRAMSKQYKNGKKLCFSLLLIGFFETWYSIFGYIQNSMTNFFKTIFKENKNGLKGAYIDLLRYKCEIYIKIIKRLSEGGAKVVFLGEDCAIDNGPMLSNSIYSSYFTPLIKKLADKCHQYGMKLLFHSDGNFNADDYELLDTIVSTGIDALHPLQANVTNPLLLRERYPNLCLCGGIDCTTLLPLGTTKEVYYSVAKMIKSVGKKGLMLGSDNSIHSGIKINNYLALKRAVNYYGRF